jgi:TATA-box binding protein (TBP) (component of TFIID and TFIIIB)
MIAFKIVNSTVTAHLSVKSIKLNSLAKYKGVDVQYEKSKFSGARIRLFSPKSTLLVFSNGKVNIMGTTSLGDAMRSVAFLIDMLCSLGHKNVSLLKINRSNIVMSAALPFCVDLIKFKCITAPASSYEPELFTGLHFADRLLSPLKMTIFTTGKFFMTGIVDEDDAVINFYLNIEPLLLECAK